MKTLKLSMLVALILSFNLAQAAPVIFESGDFVISGTTYVDTSDSNNVRGIGNITEIRKGDGSLFWDNSSDDLSIVFYDYTRTSVAPGLNGTTQFASTGGVVEFFSNSLNNFQATGDYLLDSANITSGSLQLRATGAQDSFGSTATGQFTDFNYASNGFLDVESGPWASALDTNSFLIGAALADISFNVSGGTLSTAGYNFSGSTDASVSAVPVPGAVWLFGSGLAGLIGSRKLKKQENKLAV